MTHNLFSMFRAFAPDTHLPPHLVSITTSPGGYCSQVFAGMYLHGEVAIKVRERRVGEIEIQQNNHHSPDGVVYGRSGPWEIGMGIRH